MPFLSFIFLCFFTSLPHPCQEAHFYLIAQLKNMHCCPFAHRMRFQLLSLPFQLYDFFLIILFISGCTGSPLLCKGFIWLWWLEAPLWLWCSGLVAVACCRAQALKWGSVVVAPSLSHSKACGIFPDQESNLCPLRWQAGSFPLCFQGSPPFQL